MTTKKPILHATLTKKPGNEVRHLLIYIVDGAHETKLVQLAAGLETSIATGTQYEMGQKADALAQHWVANEGFKYQSENEPLFEPLERTIALALKMGYTAVYDTRFQNFRPGRPLNATGAIPLTKWPGMTGKGGGSYEYALDGLKILARPTLPPNHGINLQPKQ